MIFDSHCHLDPSGSYETAARAHQAGVDTMLCVGVDLASSRALQDFTRQSPEHGPRLLYSAGLHPNQAGDWESCQAELREIAAAPDCVAIGETGMDFYWDRATPAQQRAAFEAQIALGRELSKPIIIHCRDAFDATFEVLAAHPQTPSVIHCFSGDVSQARIALDLGCYLSFAGPLTYPRSKDLRAAAAFAPADRICIETDAPFLPPQPYRGQPNEPAYIRETLLRLAEVRNCDFDAVALQTYENASAFFGLH